MDDVDAHFAQAKAAGATILSDLEDGFPGRRYRGDDLERRRWMFNSETAIEGAYKGIHMSQQISTKMFTDAIRYIFDETFESVHGIYLDKGTSLFETLATISAEEASIPVGGKCATIAAQVEHVRFYLDVLEQYIIGPPPEKVDWGEIWQTVSNVSEEEWANSQKRLRETYMRVSASTFAIEEWNSAEQLGGPIAIIAHTAYHLGEIRQALCVVQE